MMDRINKNTLWVDAITKDMHELERLGGFQYSPPKTKFENKALIRMIFDIKKQDLRHKERLVIGGHVLDSSEHTTH